MATLVSGGIDTTTVGFTDGYVYSTGVPMPTGRNTALDGHNYALIYGMAAYASGRGAARTLYFQIDGLGTSSTFSRGSAGSAGYTGIQPCSLLAIGGGTGVFTIYSNGSFYFGRGGSGNTHDNNGVNRTDGQLYVEMNYYSVPSKPTAPTVSSLSGTTARLAWSAPTDAGDTTLAGYVAQASTDPTFATGVTTISGIAAGTTTVDFTGLTPGATYYFRVLADNAVTVAASTHSQPSSSVSTVMGTAPSAPTGVTAAAFAGRLEVDWVAPAGGLTSYTVELSVDNFASVLSTFAGLDPTKLSKTITGLTPSTLYYARVKAVNIVGTSAASSTVSATIPARTALGLVRGASVHTRDGYQIELRSDSANAPTITLGYTPMGSASTFTSIANIPIDATAANHGTPGGMSSLALVTDAAGGLYVIGKRGDDTSTVLVKYFARLTATAWAAPTSLSQALPNTGDALVEFAAEYVVGTGVSPVASIFLLARRAGTLGAGSLSYAVIRVTAAQAGTGTLFIASGSDPSFMGAPPITGANTGLVDVSLLVYGGTRLALLGNSWAIVDVVNGVVTGVAKASAGANVVSGVTWARVLGVSSTAFAVLNVVSGALTWSFYSTSGSLLGTGTLAAASAFGGSFTDQWDAFTDIVANVVTVYYVNSTAGARSLSFIDISPATYAATAAVQLTAALGAASSTNGAVRVPSAPVDERRVMVTAANLLTGTKSTAAYVDTTGNVAPNAPVLIAIAGFDATQAKDLVWSVSDNNPLDTETAYEVQVQRVSDSASMVATGSVSSSATAYTMAANTLVNGTAYRWRARTTDALGAVGAWSAYSNLNPTAIGTLTITSPTPDNVAGINTSSVPIVWTYAQANGYVQTQRRVVVTRLADSVVLSDTTMQASVSGTYTVTGLVSDVPVAVDVSIITNAPGTPTVTVRRLITPSFAAPDVPTFTLTPDGSKIVVTVTNPVPTGSRPAVASNGVYRQRSDASDSFVRVAVIPANSTYSDHAVASGVSYDYQVVALSNAVPAATAASAIGTAAAPLLMGVWIYDPLTPDTSEVNYPYTTTRTEQNDIATAKTQLQGRTNPLVEFGTPHERSLSVGIRVPIDGLHDDAVEYLRKLYTNRRAFVYRDNRSRRIFGSLADAPTITDATDGGSVVTLKITRVDYSEAV